MRKTLAAFACLLLCVPAWTSAAAHTIPDDLELDIGSLPGGKEELLCLALNDYWEARGESVLGRLAVARVVLNRVADARYPDTVCGVVHQHLVPDIPHACQFSWTCDGRPDHPTEAASWRRSLMMAAAVLQSDAAIEDPSNGALWYHATSVRPAWTSQLVEASAIGAHIFYRDPPIAPLPLRRPMPEADVVVAEGADVDGKARLPARLVEGVMVAAHLKRPGAGPLFEQLAVAR